MIKDENYYTVHGWMLRMDLKGYELPIYAIIYGFSQDGQNEYSGSQSYLADFANCTRRSVINVLQKLEDKKLISKRIIDDNGVRKCFYKAVIPSENFSQGDVKSFHKGCENFSQGDVKSFPKGCETISHNNKYINNKDNIEYSTDLHKAVDLFEKKVRPLKDQKDVDVIKGILDDYGLEYFEKAVAKIDAPSKRRLEYIEATAKGLYEVGDFAEMKARKQGGNLVGLPSDKDSFVKMFGGKEDEDN